MTTLPLFKLGGRKVDKVDVREQTTRKLNLKQCCHGILMSKQGKERQIEFCITENPYCYTLHVI